MFGDVSFSAYVICEIFVNVEMVWLNTKHYGDMWEYHDCDTVCGIVDSLSNVSDIIVSGHTAGWYMTNGERRYFLRYGRAS